MDLAALTGVAYPLLGPAIVSCLLGPNNGDYRSGPVGAFFCDDHTHFEAAGARQIAGLVAQALQDQQILLARR
jgi:lysophospholipase L1-like esterase